MKSILLALWVAFQGLYVTSPATSVPQEFTIRGIAVESDVVHVWAFPTSGAVFLGYAVPSLPSEEMNQSSGDWNLHVSGAPIGTYSIVVYAHDPITNTFPTQIVRTYTVRACNWAAIDYQFVGPGGIPLFYLTQTCQ